MQYSKILKVFGTLGHSEYTLLDYPQIVECLNILNKSTYKIELIEQLWQQTPRTNGFVKLSDFIYTIERANIEAHRKLSIIREKIQQTKQQLANINYNTDLSQSGLNRAELEKNYKDYKQEQYLFLEDIELLTKPFGIDSIKPKFVHSNQTQFVEVNTQLEYLFYPLVISFFIEMVCTISKNQSPNILLILAILAIYFFNGLHSNYIRVILLAIILTIILDIVWLGLYFKWNPSITNAVLYDVGLLRFHMIWSIIRLFLKIILGILLLKYRNITDEYSYKITLLGNWIIYLNGKYVNRKFAGDFQKIHDYS